VRAVFRWLLGLTLIASAPVGAQTPDVAAPSRGLERVTAARIDPPKILPGTGANAFGTIKGSALTSTNNELASSAIRLRDARFGQIVDIQVTDKSGLFTFPTIDPGSYIVEILGPDQVTVIAASRVLNVSAGEVISTVVKLPFSTLTFARVFGNSPSTAVLVTAQAAASGVMATQVSGAPTCIPLQ
jgi:hypothetical protein